jgi:hypothetical protein
VGIALVICLDYSVLLIYPLDLGFHLTDNMDIRRLVEINDSYLARLRKYLKAYRQLL